MSVAAESHLEDIATGCFPELDAALRRGATVLTGNQRAARQLLAQWDRGQRAAGEKTWQAPAILSWNAWTSTLWRTAIVSGAETRVLLNSLQERELWRRIIQSGPAETLRSAASQARLCSSAVRLLGDYDVSGRFAHGSYPLHALTADAERFAGWYAEFEERCRREALMPLSHLVIELAEHLRQRQIAPAAEYVLYGFGALTPAQTLLIAAVEQSGSAVSRVSPGIPQIASPGLRRYGSGAAEMRQCAQWARQQLLDGAAAIAIIVPDLPAVRGELERELRRAVAPQLSDVTAGEQDPVYEFSSGRPLDSLRMVADALRLLRWCAGPLPLEDAGALLRSPYLQIAESPLRGAELDMHTVRCLPALRGEVLMRDVIDALPNGNGETVAHLRAVQSAARSLQREKDGYAAFADSAREVLRTAGWPGAAALNSDEHQAVDRWEETLDRVATLDLLGARASFEQFVETLAVTASDTAFAPENTGAPVQVMTVPEAAGSTADALWFLHADENSWPPKQPLNPLLPWTLQRQLGMPGADTHTGEQAARESLQALIASAGKAVFSYSCTTADGAQRPSPLVAESLPETAMEDERPGDGAPALTESHVDAEPLPQLPAGVIPGGSAVLLAQAQCGFRAFAERRLFATPVEAREAGYSAAERGDQVHTVLQEFWAEVRTRDELMRRSLPTDDGSPSARETLLIGLIEKLFPPASRSEWDAAYIDVQKKRLRKLLGAWLSFEESRPAFTGKETELEVKSAQLGRLIMDLRVDRVDHVHGNGVDGTLLMDYKTGAATAGDWNGERPNQPQLPVYAVAGGLGQVDGLAFGLVRVGRLGMKLGGAADDVKLLGNRQKATEPFADKLDRWRHDLLQLADAYADGDARVDPKEYPQTCDHCTQRMLCRVDAAAQLQIDDPLEEEEGGMPWG